jgi:ABC-type multidrug transport system fused ATPase/permease subunit
MKNNKTLKRVLVAVSKYKLWLALSLIFCAVTVVLTLAIPILVGRAIDLIIDKGNVDMIMQSLFFKCDTPIGRDFLLRFFLFYSYCLCYNM